MLARDAPPFQGHWVCVILWTDGAVTQFTTRTRHDACVSARKHVRQFRRSSPMSRALSPVLITFIDRKGRAVEVLDEDGSVIDAPASHFAPLVDQMLAALEPQ